MKFVEGSYGTTEEAFKAVKHLQEEGYKKEDIRLISNTTTRDAYANQTDINSSTETDSSQTLDEDQSFWEKIKGTFSVDDSEGNDSVHSDGDVLDGYQDDIAKGNIIVLVEGDPEVRPTPTETNPMLSEKDTRNPATMSNNEETIQLQEEKLDVGTKEVQTGEVNISKRVTEETETVEVPVKHEEIIIKRHNVTDGTQADGNLEDEEIVIPVSEEQIEVTKKPVVTEEVSIGKETVKETKQVSETVRKEDLDIESNGDVDVHDDNNLL